MRTIRWKDGVVLTIDQTRLPQELVLMELKDVDGVANAIKQMKIRGAPLIGVAAALGLALVAYHSKAASGEELFRELLEAANKLRRTRPTARNLFWALDRVLRAAQKHVDDLSELRKETIAEALAIMEEDAEVNLRISQNGARLLEDGDTVLTHCNAGSLATVEHGTALGIIKAAVREGKRLKVIATETRPLLQGARLTTFELRQEGIPVTLITDSMVGYVMARRMVSKVVVGADRILGTGHCINKIGTYTIAVLAKAHGVPFYVAAPYSTIDFETKLEEVVIEERDPSEVLVICGRRIAADDVEVLNPAFDITPPEYITAVITEKGIFRATEIPRV